MFIKGLFFTLTISLMSMPVSSIRADDSVVTPPPKASPPTPVMMSDSPVFVQQWGSLGAADGQFNQPTGVAMDTQGNLYVADTKNNRIQKFDHNGTFLLKWETASSDVPMTLNQPHGIAVDQAGNVYVADTNNSRIVKFDSNGTFLLRWVMPIQVQGPFHIPYGLAIDSANNVYVTEIYNHRLQKFDRNGTSITLWDISDKDDGKFATPLGVAIDNANNVYIADTNNHRLQQFNSNGTFLTQWGTQGTGEGQFNTPAGVTTDLVGNIYVADTNNHRIQKFAPNGKFLMQWGRNGKGEGQFDSPASLVVDQGGNAYIVDTNNNRLQKFSIPKKPGMIQFSPTAYTVAEGAGTVILTLSRTGGSDNLVSIDYTTVDGTAKAGQHYTTTKGTLNFAQGQDGEVSLSIPIIDNQLADGDNTFTVTLSNSIGGATLGTATTATVTIKDNDVVAPAPVPVPVPTPIVTPVEPIPVSPPVVINFNGSYEPTTGVISGTYNGGGKVLQDNLTIEDSANVINITFAGQVENQGWVSNSTIQDGATFNGGTLTGYITNAGTLSNIEFVGASLQGGTLSGNILNNSQVSGVLTNVKLGAKTVVRGGKLGGTITGDQNAPARLEQLTIMPGSILSNVILGKEVRLAKGVILTEGVQTSEAQCQQVKGEFNAGRCKAPRTTPSVTATCQPTNLSACQTEKECLAVQGQWVAKACTQTVMTLPDLGTGVAVNSSGEAVDTQTKFAGGVSINTDNLFQAPREVKQLTDIISLQGRITVDPVDLNKTADLVVYVTYQGTAEEQPWYLMLDHHGGFLPWDQQMSSLVAFQQEVTLAAEQAVSIYQGVLMTTGLIKVNFGYRLPTGKVVYSGKALEVKITL